MPDDPKDSYYTAGIDVPDTPPAEAALPPWEKTWIVGKRRPRVDAYERVSGAAVYPSDLALPGMLQAAILRCPHPHAQIKRVDTTQAEALPGVRAVISSRSEDAKLSWPYSDELTTALFSKHCRFEGEAVAAVAAETSYEARDALAQIAVDYEVLPFVSEAGQALDPQGVAIHQGGNLVARDRYERGDVSKGFDQADLIRQRSYSSQCELHTPLEPHGCVARWDGDHLTLWESTQGVFAVQSQVAKVLGVPLAKVRVIGHYMGGGFGSKLGAGKYSVIAALLAKRSGRPVKLFLSREETFLAVGNRPPAEMQLKAGVKKDGTLTALDFSATATGGAYPAGGTSLLDWLIRDCYTCPNVRSETTDVYINAGPARPFRAPGHPQCAWALEQLLDELAEAIGMDPVELRLKNIPTYSQGREGQPPYTTTGLAECLRQGAEAFGWKAARQQAKTQSQGPWRRGVGMASALWFAGGGGPPSTVIVKLFRDGSVNLNMGASDIGTGTKTVMALVVAEELGIRPELIQIEHADTATTQYATPSGGSKTVPTEAPTVRAAAVEVKRQLLQLAAEELKAPAHKLELEGGAVRVKGAPGRQLAIAELPALQKRGVLLGVGYRGKNPQGKVVNPFAAQFCELEVNSGTGEVRLLRFVGAHESGRVMDRLTFDNQAYGGITMGIGFGLTELRLLDHGQTGKMVNRNWHDYKLPTALDVPAEMTSVAVELPDPEANTAGAKGLGEPVTIPTAAAIANAIYHATGVRVLRAPASPLELGRRLLQQEKEG